jgi:ATP-binding cassette subfamily B protein
MVLFTMLYVNWELTLMVMLPLPILSILIYYVHSKIIKQSEIVQNELSLISSYTQEVYSGIRTVRAYNKQGLFYDNFLSFTERFKEKSINLAKIDAFFFPIIQFLIGLSIIIAVGFGGFKIYNGEVTVGNIAEFIMYVYLLTWPIASLGWVTSLTQKAAVSQERINKILEIQPDIQYPKVSKPIHHLNIDIQNISFIYPDSGIKAIKNFSLKIKEGEAIGIVGATGSGKSTLFALLTRLYDPSEGQIILDHQNLKNYSHQEIRKNITIVPQDAFLFSDTIENNIKIGKPQNFQQFMMTL